MSLWCGVFWWNVWILNLVLWRWRHCLKKMYFHVFFKCGTLLIIVNFHFGAIDPSYTEFITWHLSLLNCKILVFNFSPMNILINYFYDLFLYLSSINFWQCIGIFWDVLVADFETASYKMLIWYFCCSLRNRCLKRGIKQIVSSIYDFSMLFFVIFGIWTWQSSIHKNDIRQSVMLPMG